MFRKVFREEGRSCFLYKTNIPFKIPESFTLDVFPLRYISLWNNNRSECKIGNQENRMMPERLLRISFSFVEHLIISLEWKKVFTVSSLLCFKRSENLNFKHVVQHWKHVPLVVPADKVFQGRVKSFLKELSFSCKIIWQKRKYVHKLYVLSVLIIVRKIIQPSKI